MIIFDEYQGCLFYCFYVNIQRMADNMKWILMVLVGVGCTMIKTDKYHGADALSIDQFRKLSEIAWMISTTQHAEVEGLIPGSYWLYPTMTFSTCMGVIARFEDPILLVADEGSAMDMITKLRQAGYSNIIGYNGFKVSEYPGEKWMPKLIKANQSLSISPRTHLDVRTINQYRANGVIKGATLIPVDKLPSQYSQLADKTNIIANCASGLRARFAYSFLKNKNIDSIVIDDLFSNFASEGLDIVDYQGLKQAGTVI